MSVYDLSEFLRLSAALNYQLSAAAVGRESVIATVIGKVNLQPSDRKLLLETLEYLEMAYQSKHRRLGPMAILHPLRATALLTRTTDTLDVVDLLSMMLHDKLEDLTADKYEKDYWDTIEQRFEKMLSKRMDENGRWFLMERVGYLTKKKKDTYYTYMGRIVDKSIEIPSLVTLKLADRLDNTLDMRIDIEDPLSGIDFFQHIFQLQFVRNYRSYTPMQDHPPPAPMNGAQRMYELFKNVVTLSLIRMKRAVEANNHVARELFEAICYASMREAERIIMHIFGYHLKDVKLQQKLVMEAMDYCMNGGIGAVTAATEKHRLDGFIQRFDNPVSAARKNQLLLLYSDKELIIQGALAFIVLFQSFLNDPNFFLQGISPEGIRI